MTSYDLKNYIFENEKIEYILEELGCCSIEWHPDKNYWTATQPDKDADNKMGVVICNNAYLNYFSYSRNIHLDENKDMFYLIGKAKSFTFAETMRYVHKLLGLQYTFKKNEPKKSEETKTDPLSIFTKYDKCNKTRNVLEFNVLDEDVLNDFVPMIHVDLFKEGIIAKTIKKFGLCYSYKYKRTIFPHRYWATGELIGYNARTSVENYDLFNIKKYFISPGMHKEINLYGLWENYDAIQKAGYVVVNESEKSVLKRDSLNDSTGVAISGHSLSEEQVQILIGLDVDIIISMDNDVDIQEIRHMCEKFYHTRRIYYTLDKHSLLQPKSSIADAPNKVFEFIMKYKIKYDESEHRKYLKGLENK